MECLARIQARILLWPVAGDSTHLGESRRDLRHLIDQAPEQYRETVIANVPLHRDIMTAWEEYQGAN